jgi:cbb3-type cytochrome oxidase cytochrome c subunit
MAPQIQLGRAQQTNAVATAELYPPAPGGLARQGAEVYRANGCFYCHTRQIRQTGIECDVILQDIGTNALAVAEALVNARAGVTNVSPPSLAARLPKPILRGVHIDVAKRVEAVLKAAGAKIAVDILPLGPDIARGWGKRRTVAQDFLFDDPVMPGALRAGPDLTEVGLRLPDANWHLMHLYSPRSVVKDSSMPPYRFLFEERKLKPGQQPSPDAIPLTAAGVLHDAGAETGPPDREIAPKPEAKALVAYLLSLRANAPLFEAPMSPPPAPPSTAATNTPAQ